MTGHKQEERKVMPLTEMQRMWQEINSLRARVEWLEGRPDNI